MTSPAVAAGDTTIPDAQQPRPRSSAVPRRRTSFLGRDEDVAAVLDRLYQAPAVALVGPGGVGKTRLAYEVARNAEHQGDWEVHVVELPTSASPEAVPRVVADALRLPAAHDTTPEEALATRLSSGRPILLVLDNCEHVITGVSTLVDTLLDECPDLTVLATSRVALDVDGERVWPVGPLPVSDDGNSASVALLIDRAEAAHPGSITAAEPAEVTQLARRLDGVPLAIELAAARLGAMSVTELLGQLDDRTLHLETSRRGVEDRHRSLTALVDWSYRLLDPADQRLAERLSVFEGGFARAAAAEVCTSADAHVLDRLTAASLLTVIEDDGRSRFVMLTMIRDFLRGRLEENGTADEARRAHAEWAVATTSRLGAQLRGPDEGSTVAPFLAELDNLGAALGCAIDEGDAALVLPLVRSLEDHLLARGGREAHAWVERAVEAVGDRPDCGDVLLVAAVAAMSRGDIGRYRALVDRAERLGADGRGLLVMRRQHLGAVLVFEGRVEESVALVSSLPDRSSDGLGPASYAQTLRALPHAYSGLSIEALDFADRAVVLAEELDNPSLLGWAHYARGEALIGVDPSGAIAAYNQGLSLALAVDNTFLTGMISLALASALGRNGEPVDSLERFRESIERWQDAGAWAFLSTTLRNFGELLVRLERFEAALLVRSAIERISESSTAGGVDADRDRYLKRRFTERLGHERVDELLRESTELSRDDVVTLALDTIDDELTVRRGTSVFRVIVFTDLERSTAFMADRGDADARRLMRTYDLRTDEALARHHGTRIKGTGDGVLATFHSVADALTCVTELQVSVAAAVAAGELPLRLRVGVHAGETIADMGDIHGTVVNLTARVVDRADGGEILVTDAIRQIAVGSDRSFTALGETTLKGIPDPIALHRLEWRSPGPTSKETGRHG